MLRYCRGRLVRLPGGARHHVDDVAQEVCLAVLCALPRYRDEGRPFEAFVYGIAAHKIADLQRAAMRGPGRRSRSPRTSRSSPTRRSAPRSGRCSAATPPGPANSSPACRPRQRELVLLRIAAGLSAEETGEVLGMSPAPSGSPSTGR